MKIHLFLLLFFIQTTASLSADTVNRDKDSILMSINAIENDSVRLNYEISQLNKYMRSPFARDLADKLYEDANKLNDKEKEMIALCGYFNIANTSFNIEEIEKELKRIEEHAYKYNLYDYFFRCKRSYLSLMASNGNMEWVMNEAQKMMKEAKRLNNQIGIISSQIALAQTYKYARNNLKVIETLQDVLKSDGVEDKEKTSIYMDLYNSCHNLKRYKEGLKYLDLQKDLLNKMMKKDASAKSFFEPRLMHTENLYADTYMTLENYSKAEEHLKLSEKYYTPTCFITYFVFYHSTHASYYAHTKKWDLCFAGIDAAIKRLGDEQPMLKHAMMAQKSKHLEQAGRLSEAVLMHRELLAATDSLNLVFIQKQEEALAENHRWENGLIKHAQNTYLLSLISTIFVVLLFIVIVGFVAKLYKTHIQLKKAKNEAEVAEDIATEANRLKNALLKNISNEIEVPLNQIRKASEQTLSASSVPNKTLVEKIEKEATNLIRLLDLVVEFSKLEVGATKFNIRQVDLLGICHKAIKLINEHSGNKVEVYFTSQVETQLMRIDHDWMLSCLFAVMTPPDDYGLPSKLDFIVKYSNDGQMVVMEIIGSPLSDPTFSCQIQTIKNHINDLFIKAFDGVYEIQVSKLHPVVTISLPYKEE